MAREFALGRVFDIDFIGDERFFILVLVALTSATGYFPDVLRGASVETYWLKARSAVNL